MEQLFHFASSNWELPVERKKCENVARERNDDDNGSGRFKNKTNYIIYFDYHSQSTSLSHHLEVCPHIAFQYPIKLITPQNARFKFNEKFNKWKIFFGKSSLSPDGQKLFNHYWKLKWNWIKNFSCSLTQIRDACTKAKMHPSCADRRRERRKEHYWLFSTAHNNFRIDSTNFWGHRTSFSRAKKNFFEWEVKRSFLAPRVCAQEERKIKF